MPQTDLSREFKRMHHQGRPLILYNVWDAGSAIALAQAGSVAIATSSWAMAAAQGFADGEQIPFEFALSLIRRIVESVELPVSVDIEGGYAESPSELEVNMTRLIEVGIVGVNFEDRIVGGAGLYATGVQGKRIEALRRAAEVTGVPIFINARSDVFFGDVPHAQHSGLVNEAVARCQVYAKAGADGYFVPGLVDQGLIRDLCGQCPLPVNVMMSGQSLSCAEIACLGVSRISFGPEPWLRQRDGLAASFQTISSFPG